MAKPFEGWTILIIDNEVDNLVVTSKILSFNGAKVVTAVNGLEGLKALETMRPNVVLLDLSMPQMDGWEMLKNLRKQPDTADLTVIALTAHAMSGDRDRVMSSGFDGYISKPFELLGLVSSIQEIVNNISR